MAVTQRLELRQTQSLVMTPQMQQAIKLLQLSNIELASFLQQELDRNPLLERDDNEDSGTESPGADSGEAPKGETATSTSEASETADSPPDSHDLAASEMLPAETDAPLDTDYENHYHSDGIGPSLGAVGSGGASRSFDDEGSEFEQQLSEAPSLREHLLNQLLLDIAEPAERIIGVHLIDLLDDAGYLAGELSTVAELLDCELSHVEATLARMQDFDPPGIFARDLRECLSLQLADLNRLDPAMQALVENLDLLASRDLPRLRRICKVDDEDLTEMITEIKALQPKPALAFEAKVAEIVIPDVLMRTHRDGGWIVELNSETLPRVLVNNSYHARLTKDARNKVEQEYLAERLHAANWLVRALDQRANTILKVATEIVRQQDAFFRQGIRHLRPLTLRDVAQIIEIHESTVSRVTNNKFIASPRGTYELKYFFTSAIAGTSGEAHSAESVRHRIKALIDAENPAEVLSDDTLVAMLRRDGIDIARRTIAKYREAMHIPSSLQRKREKAVQL